MINRDQIETILKINGVAPGSPDDKIRSVLLSARYSKDEVNTAIMVLRENTTTNETRVDGLHKIFRSDEGLKPEEISQLLGIDVDISDRVSARKKARNLSTFQYVIVWTASAILAITGLMMYMYVHEVGLFHPASIFAL